jgi:hypothetical protein
MIDVPFRCLANQQQIVTWSTQETGKVRGVSLFMFKKCVEKEIVFVCVCMCACLCMFVRVSVCLCVRESTADCDMVHTRNRQGV